MKIEETNSITHLVKIVAGEVFDERMRERDDYHREEKKAEDIMNFNFLDSINFSPANAGVIWTAREDRVLIREVQAAIFKISRNHGRSKGSIRSRICQRDLI